MREFYARLKDPARAARHLNKAFEVGDPANLQGAMLDVIRSRGGYHVVAAQAQMSEWRLKLILWDDEEAWKLLRFHKLLAGMGLRLVVAVKEEPKAGK